MMPCSKCGQSRRGTTAALVDRTAPTRVATAAPVRYTVNGRKFSTLTAAQEYAKAHPGSVIRQS